MPIASCMPSPPREHPEQKHPNSNRTPEHRDNRAFQEVVPFSKFFTSFFPLRFYNASNQKRSFKKLKVTQKFTWQEIFRQKKIYSKIAYNRCLYGWLGEYDCLEKQMTATKQMCINRNKLWHSLTKEYSNCTEKGMGLSEETRVGPGHSNVDVEEGRKRTYFHHNTN